MNNIYGEKWITVESYEDLQSFKRILDAYLYFKKDTLNLVDNLLSKKPFFIMCHCFRGFLLLLSRDINKYKEVNNIIKICKKKSNVLSKKEIIYIQVLESWKRNDFFKVSKLLLGILNDDPKDILAFRLFHFNQIFIGIDKKYYEIHKNLLNFWYEKDEHYNLVLGMTSFAYEENNYLTDAKVFAEDAVKLNKEDLWSWHALAHTYDTLQENDMGIEIFDEKIKWEKFGPMKRHLWWHFSLFNYYNNNFEKCLNIYDNYIFDKDNFYLDFCNASSLLIRLKLKGIDVDSRLINLKKQADYFLKQNILPFIDYHLLLFYYFINDSNISFFSENIYENKYLNSSFNSAYKEIFKPLNNFFNNKTKDLEFLSNNFITLGGSFAQRELIHLSLLEICNKNLNSHLNFKILSKIRYKKKYKKINYV